MEQLTLFQEDSPVSPTQWPERDLEKRMTDTSGQRCLESFGKFSRHGLWAKMFSDLLIGQEGWYSTKCRLIWKLKGTKYNRMYFQLYPSTHHTEETEFGLLPTPTAMDQTSATANMKSTQVKEGSMHSVTLNRAMAIGMLPTPTVQDADKATKKWREDHQNNLTAHVFNKMLPTPTTRDCKPGQSPSGMFRKDGKSRADQLNNLPVMLGKHTKQTGEISQQLNPQFVLEMMGFPTDWTLLPFLSGETSQSKQEEMQ